MTSSQDPQDQTLPEAGHNPASTPAFLVLGRLARPHGVRGELQLVVTTAFPERIADLETVYVGVDPHDVEAAVPYKIAATRRHRDQLLVRLQTIHTREDADAMRGKLLMVALDDAVPLEEDEYYVFQVIGARVVTTEGEELGRVAEILETGANDVFIVRGGPRGEILLPDIDDVVLDVDVAKGLVTVAILPGLLPD